jgi:hypothetical protein
MALDHAPHQVESVADGADQRRATPLAETLLDLVRFVLQRRHDLAVVSAGRYGVLTMALRQVASAIGRAANVSEVQSVLELDAYGVAGYAESRAEANARDSRESIQQGVQILQVVGGRSPP